MMKNVVVIGFGEMGKRHGKDMEEHSKGLIRIAAVYEPDERRYEEGCEWMGTRPERYDDIDSMLDAVKPDGAIISSPNFCHWEGLRHFKGRNIPLILEKPLDSTLEKICEIVRFVKEYPAPVMVHHVMRYSPIVKKAKELVERQSLGKICSFRFQLNNGGSHMHNFRRNKLTGGGQLLEKATHDLDIMLHLIQSMPKQVAAICKQQRYGGDKPDDLCCSNCDEKATCSMATTIGESKEHGLKDINVSKDLCVFAKSADVPDNEICMIELENGVFGTHVNNFFMPAYYSRLYEVVGTDATMRICFTVPPCEKEVGFDGKLEVYRHDGGYEKYCFNYEKRIHYNGSPGVQEHFLDLMNGAAKPYSPVNEAFAAELIAAAAYKSNDSRQYVNIRDLLPEDIQEILKGTFMVG